MPGERVHPVWRGYRMLHGREEMKTLIVPMMLDTLVMLVVGELETSKILQMSLHHLKQAWRWLRLKVI